MRGVWETIQKKARVDFRFYDGRNIPFPNGHFEVVLAYAVFEHIPPAEVPSIIKGIGRALKPGGILYVFQLPRRASYTEFVARKLGLESHEYLWSYSSINAALVRSGFRIKFYEQVDMMINHPYKVVNPLFPILKTVNKVLLQTPLAHFAHHLTVVAEKR